MRVLVVFNHPYEGSFCSAILESAQKGLIAGGHEVDLIHLDRDGFDPVMRAKDLKAFAEAAHSPEKALAALDPQVLEYRDRLLAADHLVFIFPIWWEVMPALTKGFIDKLIFPGIAYRYKGKTGASRMVGMTKLTGVTVITTMNTPSLVYRLVFGNAIKKVILTGTFFKIGVPNRKWVSFNMVKMVSQEKRQKWLRSVETRFERLHP